MTVIGSCLWLALLPPASPAEPLIDRQALVTRHNPTLHEFDIRNPLSVGNGQFAFTVDATGLQTFADAFTNTTPLGTLSQWGWHSFPNPEGWSEEKFQFKEFDVFGRKVGYNDVPGNRQTPEIKWLRGNPHRLHLGQIGFVLIKTDGSLARTNDLTDVKQSLDLWSGLLESWFSLEGKQVYVQTVCHPDRDMVAVRVYSALVLEGRLKIQIHFPYGTGSTITADWTRPEAHETVLRRPTDDSAEFDAKAGRRHLHRFGGMVGRRKAGGSGPASIRSDTGDEHTPRGICVRVLADSCLVADVRAGPGGRVAVVGQVLEPGRRDRFVREQRSALARTRTAHRAVAIPHRDPMLGQFIRRRKPG